MKYVVKNQTIKAGWFTDAQDKIEKKSNLFWMKVQTMVGSYIHFNLLIQQKE